MIQELTDKSIAVQVPEGAYRYDIVDPNFLLFTWNNANRKSIQLPSGSWQILGKAKELTDDQWKSIVDDISFLRPNPYNIERDEVVECWQDYTDETEQLVCYTPTESGLSLLKSKSLNPGTTLILIKQP